MKAWITTLTAEYLESPDDVSYSQAIATPIKPKPAPDANVEIKIRKEMNRLLREQAIKNLGLTPTPIEPTPIEPTPIVKTPGG